MSTTIDARHIDLTPLARSRERPLTYPPPRPRSFGSYARSILAAIASLRQFLPTVTSPRTAMLDLADGYDRMARECASRGDYVGVKCHRASAKAMRQQCYPQG